MAAFTTLLRRLLEELLSNNERIQFRSLVTYLTAKPLPENAFDRIVAFDETLEGPSISRLRRASYATEDRDVFRPFQYCDVYLGMAARANEPEWLTRTIVYSSSLHVEILVKRIGSVRGLPLGTAIREHIVQQKIDARTRSQIERFTRVYNAAKHDMDHPVNTHLFSLEDALTAYVTCRKIGWILYPLVVLITDIRRYDKQPPASTSS